MMQHLKPKQIPENKFVSAEFKESAIYMMYLVTA